MLKFFVDKQTGQKLYAPGLLIQGHRNLFYLLGSPILTDLLECQCQVNLDQNNRLTHSHTMTPFDALKIYSCRKHCEKRRNCLKQAISPFLTMFSTLYDTYFSLFKMSSAISFNSDQSKIFSSGDGLKLTLFLRMNSF